MDRTANDASSLTPLFSAFVDRMSDQAFALAAFKGLIASEISIHRMKKGMSQKELADALGVTQALVSRWENGETNYTLSTLVSIADKLDIKMQSPYVPSSPAVRVSKRDNVFYTGHETVWITEPSVAAPVFHCLSSEK